MDAKTAAEVLERTTRTCPREGCQECEATRIAIAALTAALPLLMGEVVDKLAQDLGNVLNDNRPLRSPFSGRIPTQHELRHWLRAWVTNQERGNGSITEDTK